MTSDRLLIANWTYWPKGRRGVSQWWGKNISCCRRPILTSFDPQLSQKEELCVGSGGGGGVFFLMVVKGVVCVVMMVVVWWYCWVVGGGGGGSDVGGGSGMILMWSRRPWVYSTTVDCVWGGEFGVCSLPTRDRRRKGTLSGSLSWRIIYELLNKFQVCQQAVTI